MDDRLFPLPAPPAPRPHGEPDGRVVLLDLNVTLSANAELRHHVRPFTRFIQEVEMYRQWLVELICQERVVLITARHDRYRDMTLARIRDTTGWEPTVAAFNTTGLDGRQAPEIKRELLRTVVFPRYGADPTGYIALESNAQTRAMYAKAGVYAVKCPTSPGAWVALPALR